VLVVRVVCLAFVCFLIVVACVSESVCLSRGC